MTDSDTGSGVIGRRIAAFLVDGLVVAGGVYAVVSGFTRSRFRLALATTAGTGIIGIPYHVLLEGTAGQTFGKRLLGITVRRADGTSCTLTAASVRTVGRFVDWLPAGYLVGFLSMAASDRDHRIGDRLAGTVVVREADGETVEIQTTPGERIDRDTDQRERPERA